LLLINQSFIVHLVIFTVEIVSDILYGCIACAKNDIIFAEFTFSNLYNILCNNLLNGNLDFCYTLFYLNIHKYKLTVAYCCKSKLIEQYSLLFNQINGREKIMMKNKDEQ